MVQPALVKLLGGNKAIGRKAERELDFDDEIRKGFRPQVFLCFKANTGLPNAILARVLGISGRSIDRFGSSKEDARLKPVVSDRLYRAAKILALAEAVLEDREQALQWMSAKQRGLGDKKPFDLIATEAGAREVEDELLRIEHGFVA
jgi:putative toxin-antitoxin system antitoxin component (TIGR02293 family)